MKFMTDFSGMSQYGPRGESTRCAPSKKPLAAQYATIRYEAVTLRRFRTASASVVVSSLATEKTYRLRQDLAIKENLQNAARYV